MTDQYNLLINWFKQQKGVLTALSGGVDSCLVAWAARQALPKDKAIALIGDSPSLKRRDYQLAVAFCDENDIQYDVVHPDELNDPNYRTNPEDRCFWCKSSLYTVMGDYKARKYPEFTMVNGNNKSDWGDYRPGLKAADKYQAFSPLAECSMTKEDIRNMAREAGLKVWDKPASPCLSSRFPYGELITIDKLALVEKAEELLASLGFIDARVRYFGQTARVEVPEFQIQQLRESWADISAKFKNFGFSKAEIDEEGLISGKLNRLIGK
jgi:uncharacterized protein